jgi:hypothetical protein
MPKPLGYFKNDFLIGAKRTRTADIFGVNEALYQLSYSPLFKYL